MRLLTAVDQLFLLLEGRKQPMHVGGLFLFEPPLDASEDFVANLVAQMRQNKTAPTFPFNQVLSRWLFWQADEGFEVDYHFRHVALPSPARVRELLVYVSQEHGRLLNRAKPLWECHIIEGIEPISPDRPKRFALYFKIHHALVDGVAAMRLVQKSLSQSPNEAMTLPVWALMTRHRNQIDALLPIHKPIRQILTEQISTIRPVLGELKNAFLQRHHPDSVGIFQAPPSILNQPISASRRIAAQSYDFERFRNISQALQVSINDVVLAVCAGAMRRYLQDLDALPKKPLIAFVPVSLRKDKSAAGNQISFLLANLATDLEDPVSRLQCIHRSMNRGKRRFERMTQAQIINYTALAYFWQGVNLITRFYPQKQAFNLVISNISGNRQPLYWNGARLTAFYPASVLFDGQAMNITLTSYLDKIEFGITACSKVLPHVQTLLCLIEEEIALFEQVCAERKLGLRE